MEPVPDILASLLPDIAGDFSEYWPELHRHCAALTSGAG
jgi:hypothetical protein